MALIDAASTSAATTTVQAAATFYRCAIADTPPRISVPRTVQCLIVFDGSVDG